MNINLIQIDIYKDFVNIIDEYISITDSNIVLNLNFWVSNDLRFIYNIRNMIFDCI